MDKKIGVIDWLNDGLTDICIPWAAFAAEKIKTIYWTHGNLLKGDNLKGFPLKLIPDWKLGWTQLVEEMIHNNLVELSMGHHHQQYR